MVTHELPLYPSIKRELVAFTDCPLHQKLSCVAAEASIGVSTASPVASSLSDGEAAPKFPAEVYVPPIFVNVQPAGAVVSLLNPSVSVEFPPPTLKSGYKETSTS